MRWWLAGGRIVDPALGRDEIGDGFVEDERVVAPPTRTDGYARVNCGGLVVAPGFVDLHASMPDLARESRSAVAGGFTRVLLSPCNLAPIDRASTVRDLRVRALATARCRVDVAGALTQGLAGAAIAEVGLLLEAGCAALSNGSAPVRDTRLLRHLLEYVGRFRATVLVRAFDADLEAGGVVREGPRATWLGLPAIPIEAEEIGVRRIAALVRLTGTPVHLTHLWSRAGVQALRDARAEGLPLSGSTTAHHLVLDDGIVDELSYAGACRFVPPLGDAADHAALVGALRDGVLTAIATDHRPIPAHLQDHELELASPGAVGFETALPLALRAFGGDLLAVVRALSVGPASVLGAPVPSLEAGRPADIVVFDPDEEWIVDRDALWSAEINTPLVGQAVRGAVRWTLVGGRPVHEVQAKPREPWRAD
jgi:dihydroorotase